MLRYCVSPKSDFQKQFILPEDILEKIDVLMQENNIDGAIVEYEKLVSLEPYNSEFLNNLAWLYFEKGDPGKGLKFSKRAVMLSPNDVDFKDTLEEIKESLRKAKQ